MTETQCEARNAPSSGESGSLGTLRLESAGGPIKPDELGYLKSTPADMPLEEMRERFKKDGYLWVGVPVQRRLSSISNGGYEQVKGAIPREIVWQVRKDYFSYLQRFGLLKEGTDPVEGIFCGGDWRPVRSFHQMYLVRAGLGLSAYTVGTVDGNG